MYRFLSLGTECVKIQETADASQGFFVVPLLFFCLIYFHLLVLMLLMIADISSFVIVALATANARISALEVELKASAEALENANAAKVSAERAAKSAETRAKKAEKAPADANQKQFKREQSVVKRLDEISTSVGSKCFLFIVRHLLDFHFADMCFTCLICASVMQQRNLESLGDFRKQIQRTPCWPQ
jgi:ABC-type protease/lipase transport system fused ATPase/permease subunit